MIIDFRLRPPSEEFANTRMYGDDVLDRFHRLTGTVSPQDHWSVRERSLSLLIEEMDRAGIVTGVVCGRYRPGTEIENSALDRLARSYPGRFVALGSVDVLDRGRARAMVEEALVGFGFPGIHLDLGVLGLTADAKSVYPVYEQVAGLGGFVAINTSALGAREMALCNPEQLDRAARDFPGLTFVSCHGSYPYVLQMIGVAANRENVFVSPDMYMTNMPGGELYVQAALGFLQDRMLFGTGYPYTAVEDTVRRFTGLPLPEPVRKKILYDNAARLLGLSDPVADGRP